jgi:hypothetical protein
MRFNFRMWNQVMFKGESNALVVGDSDNDSF